MKKTKTNKKILNRTTLGKLRKSSRFNKIVAVGVMAVVAFVGFTLLTTLAAGYFASVKFDNASLNGTSRINDSKASNGKALQFGEKAEPEPDPGPSIPGAKPSASNTGPRKALTRTLTASQALAELRQTKKLSGVIITGSFRLSGSDGKGWVIEDSRFEQGGRYTVQSYVSLSAFTGTKAERPVLRYVDIVGPAARGSTGGSAVVYGSDIVLDHANLYGAADGIKSKGNMDILNSWVHDLDHPEGAHCDTLQIRSGTGILVKGSRFDSYVGYSSDNSGGVGNTCSGMLQTGSVVGDIQATFENNWFAGGHYTVRGYGPTDGHTVTFKFRNNKFMRSGTSVALGRTDLKPNQYGPITGNLGDYDSSNVWEDTGQPVR